MMTVEQIIQTICPKLSDSPSLSQFIQIATESLSNRFFGKLYNQAVAYKACHLFTLNDSSSGVGEALAIGGGAVTSYHEGGIDIQFKASESDNELNQTKYGRMLLSLMKSRPRMDVNRNCQPPIPQYPYLWI